MEGERSSKRRKVDSVSSQEEDEHEYEVFLSFRGEDTRLTITDHLYRGLTDVRIKTFRDNEELHVGEKIGPSLMQAIKQSKILIPIFSKGYASSKWCLMELAHMVECAGKNEGRVTICPIFYDVTPSEVRNQMGSFQEAFVQHMKVFDKERVDEWKAALRKVSDLLGWERAQIANGHESELVKQVVTKVLLELKKKHEKVTKHLVGMDQHQAELKRLFDLDSNDVRIVGIVGMGGIGKTTIAKVVYNSLCDQFHKQCSFLKDVRENVKQKGLDVLKTELMSNILGTESGGMQKKPKALIVLDDVKDRSQLRKFIGENGRGFGPGSIIIVTSRNKEIFGEEEGKKIYEPREMDSNNALRLFCKHAFRQDCPLEGYEDLSNKVVHIAAGLPLSLKVFGSLLSTKEKKVWKDTVKKLEKIMPKDVQERLKISYDMLDDVQKKIFLDIACHFINSGKDEAFAAKYMWEDCGFFPDDGINALVALSLVKIDEYSRFWMHDQLRDLGREIVRNENPDNPGRRSRLWSPEVARDVLVSQKGTQRVHTLYLGGERSVCHDLSEQVFRKLSCLRYLDLCDTYTFFGPYNLKGDFSGLLPNLRWLRWRVPSQITLTNLCLAKLVVLDLSRSEISDGCEDYIQFKAASNLKVLKLECCFKLTKTPDLSAFPKLERLNLENCSNLVEISPSIKMLTKLTYLNLNNCGKCCEEEVPDGTSSESKRKLPEFIWNLKSLVELHMNCVPITELSEAIGNLTNLQGLHLRSTAIKKLPAGVGMLRRLEVLECEDCCSLEGEIPTGVWSIPALRVLNLRGTKISGLLPSYISCCSHLTVLCVGGLRFPSSVEELTLPLGLTDVEIPLTRALLESVARLPELQSLAFYPCGDTDNLVEFSMDLGGLLHKFDGFRFLGFEKYASLPVGINNLLWLRTLLIGDDQFPWWGGWEEEGWLKFNGENFRLENIPDLPNSLEKIHISNCPSLKRLPDLPNSLDEIHICNCPSLESLPDLPNSLDEIHICNCPSLESLPDLPNSLKEIRISNCPSLESLPDLPNSLEEIWICNCPSLESLPDFSALQRLETLDIEECEKLRQIRGLEFLTSLKHLKLGEEVGIPLTTSSSLESAARLPVLQSLAIYPCSDTDNLVEFPIDLCGLLPKFGGFRFLGFEKYASLPVGINNLLWLRTLLIGDQFPWWEEWEEGWLQFNGENFRLENIPDLPNSLVKIRISNCPSLKRLPDLPNSLEEIRICNCPSLESLPDFSALQRLETLNIEECEKLRQIRGIESLTSLKHLKLGEEVGIPLTRALLESAARLPVLQSLAFYPCGDTDNLVEFPMDLCGLLPKFGGFRFLKFEEYASLPVKINNLLWLRALFIGDHENHFIFPWMEGWLKFNGENFRLENIPDLPNSLEKIHISNCPSLKRLPDLPNSLDEIWICNCPSLESLPDLPNSLKEIWICNCPSLESLPDLPNSLEEIWICNCPSLESLPDFSALQRLEELVIDECEKLRQIRGLESLTSLKRLYLGDCPSLEELPDLSHVPLCDGFKKWYRLTRKPVEDESSEEDMVLWYNCR